MAFSSNYLNVVKILLVAFLSATIVTAASVQQQQNKADGALKEGSSPMTKAQADLWQGFLDWPAFAQFKPFLGPFPGLASQFTGPASQAILSQVPGAQGMYDTFNQQGQQITSQLNDMNPMNNIISQLGGSGGFASLIPGQGSSSSGSSSKGEKQ